MKTVYDHQAKNKRFFTDKDTFTKEAALVQIITTRDKLNISLPIHILMPYKKQ